MTAKERLVEAASYPTYDYPAVPPVTASWLDRFLADPDLLLAVLAETGVLTEEKRQMRATVWHDGKPECRYVSPWVPSGDQT